MWAKPKVERLNSAYDDNEKKMEYLEKHEQMGKNLDNTWTMMINYINTHLARCKCSSKKCCNHHFAHPTSMWHLPPLLCFLNLIPHLSNFVKDQHGTHICGQCIGGTIAHVNGAHLHSSFGDEGCGRIQTGAKVPTWIWSPDIMWSWHGWDMGDIHRLYSISSNILHITCLVTHSNHFYVSNFTRSLLLGEIRNFKAFKGLRTGDVHKRSWAGHW